MSIKLLCPDSEKCLIYQNYAEKTDRKNIDIIQRVGSEYACFALVITQKPVAEGGIGIGDKLKKRIDSDPKYIGCPYLTLLNNTRKEE